MSKTYRDIALSQIIQTLQIDAARIRKTADGFIWWPGRFRVSIRMMEGTPEGVARVWKLTARTDFLKDLDLSKDQVISAIDLLSMTAPSFAWGYAPRELTNEYEMENAGRLWFQTDAYIRDDNVNWLPNFFACMVLLQPVFAEKDFEVAAEITGGIPDFSYPDEVSDPGFQDEILLVPGQIYVPSGQQPNRYAGTEELKSLGERLGRSDLCFGTSDENGATLETPVGSNSALIRLITDQPHPALGQGLLVTLTMPEIGAKLETVRNCAWNNIFQIMGWTDVPLLGTWRSFERTEDQFYCAYSTFFPNALYQDNMITNATLWMLGTVRYINHSMHPNRPNLTMRQVYEQRFGGDAT